MATPGLKPCPGTSRPSFVDCGWSIAPRSSRRRQAGTTRTTRAATSAVRDPTAGFGQVDLDGFARLTDLHTNVSAGIHDRT